MNKNLLVSNDIISTKICEQRDHFVNFLVLDDDIHRAASYGVYISQFIRFARPSNEVSYLNDRCKLLNVKFLKQSYRYHKLRKTFSRFYAFILN